MLKNAFWKFLGLLVGGGALFAFNLLLMRHAGPDDYGRWAFAAGWAGLFSVLVDFGFNPIVSRDVAQLPNLGREYLERVLKSKALLALGGFVLLCAATRLRVEAWRSFALIVGAYCFLCSSSWVETGQAFLQAYERFRRGAALSTFYRCSVALAGVAAIWMRLPLEKIMLVICIVALCGVLINVAVLAHVLRRSKTERSPALESLWRKALPLFLQNVFILVYFKIDTVMLGMMRGDHETGLYGAAYRFFEISNVVPTALLAVMSAPLARRMAAGDWKAFWKRGLALFMAAAFTGFAVLGGGITWLLPIVAGPNYIPSQPLLRILSLTILFYFPNYFLTMTLVFLKKTVANAWIAATAMIFNVTANWFAIQRWGAAGAAWMTLVTEMFISAGCLAIIYRTVRREGKAVTV